MFYLAFLGTESLSCYLGDEGLDPLENFCLSSWRWPELFLAKGNLRQYRAMCMKVPSVPYGLHVQKGLEDKPTRSLTCPMTKLKMN